MYYVISVMLGQHGTIDMSFQLFPEVKTRPARRTDETDVFTKFFHSLVFLSVSSILPSLHSFVLMFFVAGPVLTSVYEKIAQLVLLLAVVARSQVQKCDPQLFLKF